MPARYVMLPALLGLLILAGGVPATAKPVKPAPALDTEFMERREAPARDFDVHHLRLDLRIDIEARRVAGEAAITLSPLAAARDEIVLHAVGLGVEEVEVAEFGPARFHVEPELLRIELPRPHAPGETLRVHIRYAVTEPKLGLYFIAPDEAYKRPLQVWSQGEMQEHRFWFPAWDYPNERATSEMVVTVPAGFTAISNGGLESRKENRDGTVTFHWEERRPHVNYLVSLVVGKFAHIADKYGAVPLDIYVPPGSEGLAARSFENTGDMMQVFERAFGHPYPYEKYAQITVHDFRWGGMENVSATTLTERTLHDEAAHLTYRSDGLVAHELAHQWFGDMITCRSWSHIWLNEAFATFADLVYYEAKWGEDGRAEKLLDLRHGYLEEYGKDYRRAIVTDIYADAIDLFDAHTYEKGALILHMLRNLLGDEVFWESLRHYVEQYAWQTVDTAQFRAAFEEASGRDLGLFFEQWLHRGGHPVLEAMWRWEEDERQVTIEVNQIQEVDELTPVFDTPLAIRIVAPAEEGAGGSDGSDETTDHRVRLRRPREVFRFAAEQRPRIVQLDPEGWLLAEIEFQKPAGEWALELAEAHEVMGRVAAARALGGFIGEGVALAALERALRTDPSPNVRREAAMSLGTLGTEDALAVLAAGVGDPEARVRLKVAEALGSFRSERAARLAAQLIDEDRSPYVVGEAAAALGHTQAKGALDRLVRAARRPSHDEIIRRGAYDGMAALEDEAALPHLLAATRYGVPWRARGQAIESLGKLAKALPELRREIRARLLELAGDRHFDARRTAVAALGKSEDSEALADLRLLARNAPEPGVRRAARAAVWKVLKADRPDGGELVKRLQEVERESHELREDVERLRERTARDSHTTDRR